MQSFVRGWMLNIIAVVILAVLVDIILPGNSYKKYTGFVFGLILIVVILQPLLHILRHSEELIESVIGNSAAMENEVLKKQVEIFGGIHNEQVLETYKRNLELSIAALIDNALGSDDTSVSITFRHNSDGFDPSNIDRLDIETSISQNSTNVKPVIIGIGNRYRNENAFTEAQMKESIKELLSEIYRINSEKLFINFN